MGTFGAILEKVDEILELLHLPKVKSTLKKLLGRYRDRRISAVNQDLLQAIRRAQLEAIGLIHRAHRDELARQTEKVLHDDQAFSDALHDFLAARLKLHTDKTIEVGSLQQEVVDDALLNASGNPAKGEVPRDGSLGQQSYDRTLDEVKSQTPFEPPIRFMRHFSGSGGGHGWRGHFLALMARKLVDDDGLNRLFELSRQQRRDALRQVARAPALPQQPDTAAFVWPAPQDFSEFARLKTKDFDGRVQLTRSILQWVDDPHGQHRAMLITAPFGVGKSAFMAHLYSERERQVPRVTIAHFCRFDDSQSLRPGRIVRAIAGQIAKMVPAYARRVDESPDLRARLAEQAADETPLGAWSQGVLAPLQGLSEADIPPHPLLLLIDGLDESTELLDTGAQGGENLLDLVARPTENRLPRWMRLVIASRPSDKLSALQARFKIVDLLNDQDIDNAADLRAHVASQTARHAARIPFAELGGAGSQQTFVERVVAACNGKFLLASHLFESIERKELSARAMSSFLQQSASVPGIVAFYEEAFRYRVPRSGVSKAKTVAVLGIIGVARLPLSERAIAAVLDLPADEVKSVVLALGGFIKHDASRGGGCTFDHVSLEDWLDPTRLGDFSRELPKSTEYAFDRPGSEARIEKHCERLARLPDPMAKAGDFGPYLAAFGVNHLLHIHELALSLSLLPAASSYPRDESKVIDALARQLALARGGKPAAADTLKALPVDALATVLKRKGYETGKYEPVIRTLVQYHPGAWQEIMESLLPTDKNDLVFRCDSGVAMAEAWHAADAGLKPARLQQITELVDTAPGGPRREIAGYALKHICQRASPSPWWQPIAADIKKCVAIYASSESPIDRMVAGEMLLALAIQGEAVTRWPVGAPAGMDFWDPIWPNHRADVDAIRVVEAERSATIAALDAHDASLQACLEQHQAAKRLRSELLGHPYLKGGEHDPHKERLHDVVRSPPARQQSEKSLLDDAHDDIARLVDGTSEQQEFALELITLVLLHPLWDVTESAANLLSDLIKGDKKRQWLVKRLLAAPARQWRVLYGAVDAAYSAGSEIGYELFQQALLAVGQTLQCRLRGICADDLCAWLREASTRQRQQILEQPEMVQLIHCWVETADDIWLLEYLHKLFHDLYNGDKADPNLIPHLIPEKLSAYLDEACGRPFYTLSEPDFLRAVERFGQQERARPRARSTAG
ncbi:MAG TPA: hypothetical protein VI032_14910 [Burkholderiaceae bacterium]